MRVTLHLTRRCNLGCTYCYADTTAAARPEPAGEMSLETAQRAVDFVLRGSDARAHVVFFGGEPTLRLDLIEKVAEYALGEAKRLGKTLTLEITTNGTLVNDRLLRLIRRTGMIVSVSLDGPRDVHDTHRRLKTGGGSFELLDRNLGRLLEAVPWLIASSVVTPVTAAHLSRSVEWLIERGFRVVMTSLDHSAAWTERDLGVLEEQLEKLGARYQQWTREGRKFYLGCLDGAIRSHIRGPSDQQTGCGAGRDHYSVAPDGRLFPCVQFVGRRDADAWLLGDLQSGIDPDCAARVLPRLVPKDQGCGGCSLRQRCASGCPCANLAATGWPDQVSPVACASQRASIAAADRAATRLYRIRSKPFVHKHYNRLYPVASCLEESVFSKESSHAEGKAPPAPAG